MVLHIRNMVCHRCRLAVEDILHTAGLHPVRVDLGEVEIAEKKISQLQRNALQKLLTDLGFALIDNRQALLVEQIKNRVLQWISPPVESSSLKMSRRLSRELHHDYSYLSKLFSETTGMTIEQFTIEARVEKVKEWLRYNEKSLAEIAYELGYSSPAHLSTQFKKMTGLTPTAFRRNLALPRQELDRLAGPK